jgi:ppGpp synthetase/RelA/SpoT-type nucleotidyltranferase
VSITIQREVDDYFANPRKVAAYKTLHAKVRSISEAVAAALGPNVVRAVYGRDDKQGGDLFKSRRKIARALAAKRAANAAARILAVDDIIGLTAVVYYPDEIELFRKALLAQVAASFSVCKDRSVVAHGYHAHHIVLQSNEAEHADLCCEIQVKTMMHDSWAAKMHDLNYKPLGHTDRRLADMMEILGDALQSVERQSQILRNLIHERWNAEVQRRRGARRSLFTLIPGEEWQSALAPAAREVYAAIRDASLLPDKPDWSGLEKRVIVAARQSAHDGMWLSLCLAAVSGDADHATLATDKVGLYLDGLAERQRPGGGVSSALWCLPLALSACGYLDGAIDVSERICGLAGVSGEEMAMVKFNLANFLVEQAIFEPIQTDFSSLREKLDALLADCAHIESKDPSAFYDLRGMMCVALSANPDEVRKGIDLIAAGMQDVPAGMQDVARVYFELHSRLAWRRLLELEAATGFSPPNVVLPNFAVPAGFDAS